MKIKFYKPDLLFSILFLSAIVLLSSCINNTQDISGSKIKIPKHGKSNTDFSGAMEYEFNMIKNPATGRIPEGSFEGELAQAKAILANQQKNKIEAAGTPYTFQGPNNLGGRTRTIAYDIRFDGASNQIILAGGVSGGVYKSIDNGATWVRKSPAGAHFSCTSIAQDTRLGFRDTWYYGVGEASGNSASGGGAGGAAFYLGNGVYKSTDNGETWTHLPGLNSTTLEGFNHRADLVTKVVVNPINGNVYAAAMDAIYRSTDGGTIWSVILTSGSAGWSSGMMTDIIVTSTGRFYAAFEGGCNTLPTDMPGVWTSLTGALGSWTKIAGGGAGPSPAGWNAAGFYGRVVLAYAPSLESKVYALYSISVPACTIEAELFEWDDGTSTWTERSANLPAELPCHTGNSPFAVQGGYDLVMAVKPDDPLIVFLGGTNIYRSTSGFSTAVATTRIGGYSAPGTYSAYLGSHPDIHSIVFSPISSTTMLCGNDGGIQRTTANLATPVVWAPINTGYRTYQYYYVDIDPRIGNSKVIGGAQDNGSTRNIGGTGSSFESVLTGDGVSVGLSDIIAAAQWEYVGFQNGEIISRESTFPSGSGYLITPAGESGTGLFVTLFKLDQDNTERLYYANDNALYRTTTASTLGPGPGTWTSMTGIAASVGGANDITALAMTRGTYSAVTASLFMGTSNGKVFRLNDPTGVAAATAPVDITGAAFPVGAYVSSLAVNPRNDDTVLVTFSNYGVTSVFWTGTANSAVPTWTAVEGALTLLSYRSSAIAVTAGGVEYFVGTSAGLYNSLGLPGAVAWTQEAATDIGNAVVTSLSLRKSDNKLLVGTHGYGMWSTFLSLPLVPVTLTEFKGTLLDKNVLLQWNTSVEVNSKHFELEKSFDGTNYKKIATVPAAGYSNSARQYGFTDREPLTEKNYYRLRSVDMDNKYKLSNIVLIRPPGMHQDILVLGNPFKENILVRFVKAPETGGELRLTDMAGRLRAKQKFNPGEQQMQFILPAGKLSRGVYQLQAEINGRKFIRQVIKD